MKQAYINNFLESEISAVLHPKTERQRKEAKLLFSYVYRLIKQFRLHSVDIEEVLNESFLRAIKYVEKEGKYIKNFPGFIRRTSLNVVREMKRSQKKYLVVDYDYLQNIPAINLVNELNCEDYSQSQQQSLRLALDELTKQEYLIISLWKINGYSWKEIVQELNSCDENVSLAAARKRGQRIWSKLTNKVKGGSIK